MLSMEPNAESGHFWKKQWVSYEFYEFCMSFVWILYEFCMNFYVVYM